MNERLKLINIHKTFEAGTVNENHVLKGINLTLYEGDFVTVIGGNGAGKSTLLNTVSGNFLPEAGNIILEGQDITTWPTEIRARLISRVFQDTKMGTASRLTIEENIALASKRGEDRGLTRGVKHNDRLAMKERLATLQLGLEDRLTTDVAFLSGGQRQALTLLMATMVYPRLLLLDEHTAALDPKVSDMVLDITRRIVEEQQITTLMITHNMEDALRLGNRLIMLHQGQVILDVAGEEKAQLTVPSLLEMFRRESGEAITSDSMLLL